MNWQFEQQAEWGNSEGKQSAEMQQGSREEASIHSQQPWQTSMGGHWGGKGGFPWAEQIQRREWTPQEGWQEWKYDERTEAQQTSSMERMGVQGQTEQKKGKWGGPGEHRQHTLTSQKGKWGGNPLSWEKEQLEQQIIRQTQQQQQERRRIAHLENL